MFQELTNSKAHSNEHNLYEELVELLNYHKKMINDIAWVECMDYPKGKHPVRYRIPMENFVNIAKNTWYDPYEWLIQIPMNLRIYGKQRSFLIVVEEYDGQQNLEYINMEIDMPEKCRMVKLFMVESGDYNYKPIWADDE